MCVLRYHHSKHSLKNGVKSYVLTISAFHYTIGLRQLFPYPCREEKQKNDDTIKTSTNEAYGEIKQGEVYEMIVILPSGPTVPTDEEGMYESPSVSTLPLPAIPPTGGKEEEENGTIPGDN